MSVPFLSSIRHRRIVAIMVLFSLFVFGLFALMESATAGAGAVVSGNRKEAKEMKGVKEAKEAKVSEMKGTKEAKAVVKVNVPGFFIQDLDSTNSATFDYVTSNFGLLDTFNVPSIDSQDLEKRDHDDDDDDDDDKDEDDEDKNKDDDNDEEEESTKEAPWKKFKKAIKKLNKNAPKGTAYKVLYLARHGQGYHNVAESFYGTEQWDCYWSLQDGNETSRWDDAELTNIGIAEAQKANIAFKDQIKAGFPIPEVYYSSPMSRAASTLDITWRDITLNKDSTPAPIFKEKCRETLGIHTCDRRNTKSYLHTKYPKFVFENGFAETDELWDPVYREPNDVRNIRLGKALDEIFAERREATFISITAHSGAITSILEVIGHRKFGLQTGGVIPVVVKVEYDATPTPTTSVSPSGTAPACAVDPTTTSSSSE